MFHWKIGVTAPLAIVLALGACSQAPSPPPSPPPSSSVAPSATGSPAPTATADSITQVTAACADKGADGTRLRDDTLDCTATIEYEQLPPDAACIREGEPVAVDWAVAFEPPEDMRLAVVVTFVGSRQVTLVAETAGGKVVRFAEEATVPCTPA